MSAFSTDLLFKLLPGKLFYKTARLTWHLNGMYDNNSAFEKSLMEMQKEAEQDIKILLADDDKDDRFFFKLALKGLKFATSLATVNDGVQLIDYLNKNHDNLPDVIFLDLNMPIKNGFEALNEIEENPAFKAIPVVIYSTSYDDEVAESLYEKGASFYIRKTDIENLRDILRRFFSKYSVNSFARPEKEEFAFSV